jgi:hypothetical protein
VSASKTASTTRIEVIVFIMVYLPFGCLMLIIRKNENIGRLSCVATIYNELLSESQGKFSFFLASHFSLIAWIFSIHGDI